MRREFCQACSFNRYGVKTRRAIPHTCGIDDIVIESKKKKKKKKKGD